jgi:hypothetical protein
MVKGLKSTSSQIVISGTISESAPNTFTSTEVDLQLNVLDREIWVCTGLDLDAASGGGPDGIAATNTKVTMSLSTTARTTIGGINDSNVLGAVSKTIRAAGFADAGVGFQEQHPDAPTGAALEYIGLIATNNFHVQIEGDNNLAAKNGNFRMWGYRAVADAATFAALTQSELLSA